MESTTWYYRFDNNGNLKEMTPNGSNPGNGAIRYTYTGANQLNKIETHNGSTYVTLAQMAYDGIGSRVVLTGWVSSVAYTTTYASRIAGKVQILQAASGANTTSYLYGLNQIGEFGLQSVYYLTDGAGSIRHLVDLNGAVKLARMYEPFGQVLLQSGTGDPIYGYLGTQFDRISGLLYINGAYYDPITGRFLSPSTGGTNPYVPLGGAALAPILILALIGRRKRSKIWTGWLVVALMVSAGLTMAACGGEPVPQPAPTTPRPITTPPTPTSNPVPIPPSVTPTPSPVSLPSPTATCTPTWTPLAPQWLEGDFTITHYTFALESDPIYANDQRVSANGLPPERQYREGFLFGPSGIRQQGTGLAEDGEYITIDWTRGNPRGSREEVYFTYGIGGRDAPPVAWQTVATGDSRLPAGTRITIEVYPGRIFTVTDSGDAVGARHIDIFVGALTLDEANQLGTQTSRVAIVP